MSSDTYQCKVLATGDRHIDLSMTILEPTGAVDFSPTLVLHALSDVCEPASLGGLMDAETARRLAREHIRGLQLLSEEGREAVFRVGLDPSWVEALSTLEWGTTAYPVDGPTAVGVATNSAESKLLVGWTVGRDGPAYAALHGLARSGVGKRKAILDHHALVGVAGADKHWWTAGGRTVKVWSSAGKLQQIIELAARASAMTSSPTGPLLGLDDGRVQRLGGGTLVHGESRATALAAAGEHVIAGFEDGSIWTTAGGRCALDDGPVDEVAIAGDGGWAAVSGGRLRRGRGATFGAPETEIETRTVSFFEHGQDGSRLALLQRTSVGVLDLASDAPPVFLPMPSGPVKAATRGTITWAASRSRLDVWRGEHRVASATGDWELSSSQTVPQVSPDEAWLAAAKGSLGHEGHLFDLTTGRVRRLVPPEECAGSSIQGLYWLSDDRLLVQFSDFYRLRVYRPSDDTFEAHELESGYLLVHDRRIALLSARTDDDSRLHVLVDGESVATHDRDDAHADAASSTGAIVTSEREDDGLTLLHRPDGSTVALPRLRKARFSADGRWLVIALDERSGVELWDVVSGTRTSQIAVEAQAVAVDDDGTVRVAASDSVTTYPLSGAPSSWTPGSIQVEFPYVSVARGDDGWLVASTQPAERHRVATLPSGRIVQLGRRVRVLPAGADVPRRPR